MVNAVEFVSRLRAAVTPPITTGYIPRRYDHVRLGGEVYRVDAVGDTALTSLLIGKSAVRAWLRTAIVRRAADGEQRVDFEWPPAVAA